jgi:hypothetical protein
VLRAVITFVVVFALLAVVLGLFGWAGPLEVLLLILLSALLTVGLLRVHARRRSTP